MQKPTISDPSRGLRVALLVTSFVSAPVAASAQSLITTDGVIVAATGDAVPDATGTAIPNLTFGNAIDDPVLDELGNVLFRAPLVDSVTPVTGINDRGFYNGSSRATLKLVARGGDHAPGMAAGVLLRTALGTSTGLSSIVRLSPDGRMWWASKIHDGGVTITASNDDPAFYGPFGGQALLLSDGMVAPGTGGAQYAQAFSSPSAGFEGINRNGHVFHRSTLVTGTGTPVVTTTAGMNNQQGLWAGLPGAQVLIARKSDPVQGLGGEVAIDNSNSLSFHMASNDSNKVLFDLTLSTTQGSPMATAANDRLLMVYTPGSGNQVLVRESDVAPGTAGGTFNSISVTDNWGASLPQNSWLSTDEVIFNTELRGGDTVAGVNDRAIYRGGVGTLAMVARRGDVAPGTSGEAWLGFNTNNTLHNENGQVAFQAFMNLGGPVTSSNDSGIWAGVPGLLQLIVREGDVMPGTGGSISTNYNGANVYFNNANQILFVNTLSGGARPGVSLWVWDAALGLRAVILSGDQVEVTPGVFKTVASASSFSGNQISNNDGAAAMFMHDGKVCVRVTFTDTTRAVIIVPLAPADKREFCSNDTLGNDHTTACPCGNVGAAGNGCAHSFDVNGANITSTGVVSADTIVLASSNEPATAFTLFMQHDALGDAVFHDGVLCAGGNLVRLRGRSAVAGAAMFPDSNFANDATLTLSQRGGVFPGQGVTRYYAAWYRNASTTFCPPATANVTNGIAIDW